MSDEGYEDLDAELEQLKAREHMLKMERKLREVKAGGDAEKVKKEKVKLYEARRAARIALGRADEVTEKLAAKDARQGASVPVPSVVVEEN